MSTTRVRVFQAYGGYKLTCSYATGDLEGLKVGHDFTDMDEGEARILTLKDSRILDNEGWCQFHQDGRSRRSLTCRF